MAVAAFATPPAVWTEHNDNARTGQNLSETILTPSNVNVNQFGALFHYTLDDQSFSQPLYVPGLTMSVDNQSHNVVFVATVNNSVYAFDADSGTANGGNPLWHINLTPSGARAPNNSDMDALGACGGDYVDFQGQFGIVGTPVIDTSTDTLYLVARTVENGSTWVQRLHALDCRSGAEKFGGPIVISGSYSGTSLNPMLNNQRTALALVNGVVYIGWSSHCDYGAYHGYVAGYNASNLNQVAVWASTNSAGSQGGIWQGGQAFAADSNNNLYLMTGNGTWDGNGNYGESFVKLAGGSLTVQDYFTPNNYGSLNSVDDDLGSAGCLLIPGTNDVFGGGKEGTVYLVNTANMGHENGTDQVIQEFQATFPPNGDTGHIHGGPVYFDSANGPYVYLWGENDYLHTFQFNGSTFNSTSVANSTMKAPVSGIGMPGGFLSISANGNTNGILWALTSYNGDANHYTVPGILHAFDAQNFSNGSLNELWNSQQNASRDSFGNYAKFTYPTVVNGKVYVSTFGTATAGSGGLWAYGEVTNTTQPGTLQIDCGGGAVSPFIADTDFNAGNEFSSTASINTSGVTNPAPQGVYQTCRWNPSFTYTIPGLTAGASYTVRLHFAELTWTAAGQRVFNVAINGSPALTNFDIFATAGGQNKAVVEQFTETANASGQIVIAFSAGSADNPEINGIEVIPNGQVTVPPAPTGLTTTAGNATVSLNWTGSSGATSYNVYRGTSSGGESSTPIATGLTGTSYTDSSVSNGTTYFYKVAAVNSAGTSGQSNEASATPTLPVPPAPTNLTANGGNATVSLTWSSSSGATSYSVYRGTSSGGEGSTAIGTSTGTSYNDSTATNGTKYYYTVKAVDASGASGASNEASATPSAGAPPAPTGLSATGGNATVGLTWSSSSGATSYSVYRGTSSGGESSTAIGTSTSTSYTDSAVSNGTTYYYTVKAVSGGGTSGASNEASATPSGGTTAVYQIDCGGGAVSPFVADEFFNTGNEFSSTNTINTSGVTNPAPAAVYQTVRWATAFNYTIPGLTAGQSYTVRLHFCELTWTAAGQRVFNVAINGNSFLSNFDIFATAGGQNKALVEQTTATANSSGQIVISLTQGSADNPEIAGIEIDGSGGGGGTAPPAPTGLSASGGNATVSLVWSSSSGATSYNVYRGTSSGGEGSTAIGTSTGTSYTDISVSNGTTYFYKVTAVNSVGTSGQSNEASATPQPSLPPAPTGLSASGGNASVSLTWSSSSGATSYSVYRGTSSGGEGSTAIGTSTGASYADNSVTNGTKYYYTVKAVNSSGASGASNEASATPTAGVPPAPTNLTATGGNAMVSLTWSSSSGATSYSVYRGTSSGGEGSTAIGTSTGTSYSDSSVTNGTTYYYTVKAVSSGGTSGASNEAHATPSAGLTAVYQIDCGSPSAVSPFTADEFFNTGNEFSSSATINTSGVTNAAPAAVYQSVRWNSSFAYTIPNLTAGATYTVRLHFCELTWTAAGQRLFNVAINGNSYLSNFDIFATAGAQNKALVEQTTATANSGGQIVISFTQGSADNPEIAGIEILH